MSTTERPSTWQVDWQRFVCGRCGAWRRLPPDVSRDCPRCGRLMRAPVAPPRRVRKPKGRAELNTERTPMRPWVRCSVCGGIHWVRRPIAEQCPGAPQ